MSVREQIMAAIEARLKTIKAGWDIALPEGDYTFMTDAGASVTLRRRIPLNDQFTRAIDIIDPRCERDRERGEFGVYRHILTVEIHIAAQGSGCDAAARHMAQDVMACVRHDPRWGGLAYWSDNESVDTESTQAAQPQAFAILTLSVRYRAPHWEA